jgi:hypothetical protein
MMEDLGRASISRCTTSRSAAPARCWANRRAARCRRSASASTSTCSSHAVRSLKAGKEPDLEGPLHAPPSRSTCTRPRCCPRTSARRRPRTPRALQALRELRDRRPAREDVRGDRRPLRPAAAAGRKRPGIGQNGATHEPVLAFPPPLAPAAVAGRAGAAGRARAGRRSPGPPLCRRRAARRRHRRARLRGGQQAGRHGLGVRPPRPAAGQQRRAAGSGHRRRRAPGRRQPPAAPAAPARKVTSAGRFLTEAGRNHRGEDIVWLDYDAALSMHRVRQVAGEQRPQRLQTPGVADNRISYGCINVPDRFYDRTIDPLFARQSAWSMCCRKPSRSSAGLRSHAIWTRPPHDPSIQHYFGLQRLSSKRQQLFFQ